MEAVEQMVFVKVDELAECSKRMINHMGQAEALMNLPCEDRLLLSHFHNAPSKMLDDIRGLNEYETQSEKLARKLRESPFFGIGLAAMAGVCAAGAVRFRRGPLPLPTSQYLMQLRVVAQSACVGSLVAGTAYTMATQGHHHTGDV